MVKRKASNPQRISEDERNRQSWNLTGPSSDDSVPSVSEEDVGQDVEIEPTEEQKPRLTPAASRKGGKKKKKRRKDSGEQEDETLNQLIDDCHFYLTVVDQTPDGCIGKLGKIELGITDCPTPPLKFRSNFWVYVSKIPGRSFVYYEWSHSERDCADCNLETLRQNGSIHVVYRVLEGQSSSPPFLLLEALRNKRYALVFSGYDGDERRVEIDAFLTDVGQVVLSNPSDFYRYKFRKDVCIVMSHFYGIASPVDFKDTEQNRGQSVDYFYSAIRELRQSIGVDVDPQHRDLLPKLRLYQVDAVKWMLWKENFGCQSTEDHLSEQDTLHPLYSQVKLEDGYVFYYNPYGGYLVSTKPLSSRSLPGGILADEMGLGKTVEVLACILCNPRPTVQLQQILREHDTKTTSSADLESLTKNNKVLKEITASKEYFTKSVEQKPFFECICGSKLFNDDFEVRVQCEKCGLFQHASCVKYDLDSDTLEKYYCPHCWITMTPYPSRATLLVSPASISHQWLEEIQRHIQRESLKILMYTGVQNMGFIQPPSLADHDIVIISYATMRKEVDYVDLPHSNSEQGRRFRHPKRFMAVPSPLVAVDWWRVCLDEAQMVECSTAKTAEMALRLTAMNRWCITGTPIQKSINDLYGLLLFLGVDPYCIRAWWSECILEPYFRGDKEPMHRLVSSILWRTDKKDVLDQIDIPKQEEEIHWLSFTPVEEHFYRRQHIDCSFDMVKRLGCFIDTDTKLNSLDRHTLNNLLAPLLGLRQACCHPQIVRGQFMAMKKNTLTMEELLDSLIKKAKLESEEAHRLMIASLNGLAAIHIIKEEWAEAVEKYREVLRSANELKSKIKTDKLQRLHTLSNLADILEAKHEGIPPTLNDQNIRKETKELHDKYLEKCLKKVSDSREVLKQLVDTVQELTNSFTSATKWWACILSWAATDAEIAEDVINRVKTEIANVSSLDAGISNRFRDSRGLQYILSRQLDDLDKSHIAVSKAVHSLKDKPSMDVINGAVECHLRPTAANPKKCIYCNVQSLFNRYESKLFSYEEDRLYDEATRSLRRGTWADGETEQILKGVLAFARHRENLPCDDWIKDGQNHLKLFEALKKEFRGLRGVWMQLQDQASALDELGMANTRLRVRLPDEPRPDPPQPDVLEQTEVDHHKLKLSSDRIIANNDLQKKLGQLIYLQTLSKSDYSKRGGSNPEPCPICQHTLGEQWSVLQCGHCFCVNCIRILVTNYNISPKSRSLKCAVCRQITSHSEISYVTTKVEASKEELEIVVKGSHSTKVEAVVRQLLRIKAEEPSSKTLVFSTWQEVLNLLGNALQQNGITFRSLVMNKFQNNLDAFKQDASINALLLPVRSGANGLNLIEATHVILVEPILNPASELQAIGRVHRIGQTKVTTVHRFLIRRTIEERMHNMLKVLTTNVSGHNTEENILTVKDLMHLFTAENNDEQ